MSVLWKHVPVDSVSASGSHPHPQGSAWQPNVCDQKSNPIFEDDEFRLHSYLEGQGRQTVLMAAPGTAVRINGRQIIGGLATLDHQDEICVDGQRWYFSAESQPEVKAYVAEGTRPPRCAICRGKIEAGQAVVRCPGCGRLFHEIRAPDTTQDEGEQREQQFEDKRCWTYGDKCKFCLHPTDLSGESNWQPGLEEAEYEYQ